MAVPTIVFSGWPDMSYGTFGGRILPLKNSLVIMEVQSTLFCNGSLAKTIKYWIWSTNNCIAKHRTYLFGLKYGVHLTGSHQIIMK
jgi:hypothetical protein